MRNDCDLTTSFPSADRFPCEPAGRSCNLERKGIGFRFPWTRRRSPLCESRVSTLNPRRDAFATRRAADRVTPPLLLISIKPSDQLLLPMILPANNRFRGSPPGKFGSGRRLLTSQFYKLAPDYYSKSALQYYYADSLTTDGAFLVLFTYSNFVSCRWINSAVGKNPRKEFFVIKNNGLIVTDHTRVKKFPEFFLQTKPRQKLADLFSVNTLKPTFYQSVPMFTQLLKKLSELIL